MTKETVSDEAQYFHEMINQLKEKLETATRNEQHQVLSVLPKSWTANKIQREFDVSYHCADSVKKHVAECGILALPRPKRGKSLDDTTLELIERFYNSDEVSRVQPGRKDFVNIPVNGVKTTVKMHIFNSGN